MSNDPTFDWFASAGETEPTTKTPSTGDPDADAVLAEMAQPAAAPFDPDEYLAQQIAEQDKCPADISPVAWAWGFHPAQPSAIDPFDIQAVLEQIDRQWLTNWTPDTFAN
jgi:hypothetical protein